MALLDPHGDLVVQAGNGSYVVSGASITLPGLICPGRLTLRGNTANLFADSLHGNAAANQAVGVVLGPSPPGDVGADDDAVGALARALLHQPPLLFLDEPTSGLDPEAAQQVNALIESLSHKGQTIILCTHNLTEAERLCDRVAVMNNGRALALGSLTDLSRKLWPAIWVDVKFWEVPSADQLEAAKNFQSVKQAEAASDSLSVRLESKESIPAFVRHLVETGSSILGVNPRAHSLEDVYFAIQNGKKEGEQ